MISGFLLWLFLTNFDMMTIRPTLPFTLVVLFACAPNVRIVDRYAMNEKKTVEVVKGNGNEARVTKRIHYYSNGQIKSEINISNGEANGKFITFHSNGAVASKGKFYSGKERGEWVWTNAKGSVDSIHTYKDGILHGKTQYYNGEKLIISQKYSDGELNGKFIENYPTGLKKVSGKYLNDLPHDKWIWWEADKSKSRLVNFSNGIKHGNIQVWNEGRAVLSGSFDQDQKSGTWKWHRSKKDLDSLANYSKGLLNGPYKAWHSNGQIAVNGTFLNGMLQGFWKWYSEDDILDSSKTFTQGLLNGPSKFYYKNGQLKRSVYFASNFLQGEDNSYFSSGQIKEKTTYQSGKKTGPYEIWNTSARPAEKGSFIDDELNGMIQRWYYTGASASIASYKAGILDGVMQVFTLSNRLKRELFYDKGKEIARLEYHDNGRFKRVIIIDNGKLEYERKWNQSGVEETAEVFITGTRMDSDFYLSGVLKYECIYKGKSKHGMEWWFDESRNPTKVNLFLNGNEILSHELSYETNE